MLNKPSALDGAEALHGFVVFDRPADPEGAVVLKRTMAFDWAFLFNDASPDRAGQTDFTLDV